MALPDELAEPVPAARRPTDLGRILGSAVGWFTIVMCIGLGLWSVDFQVEAWIQEIAAWSTAFALLAWMLLHTPSSRLTPIECDRRDRRRLAGLVGASTAVCLLAGYVAAQQLETWADWAVLIGIVCCTIGVGITLHSHLLFRRG